MNRILQLGSLGLLAAVLALYLGDAAAFAVRKQRGTAYRVIEVNQFLTTPLKGNKEEYDVAGSESVTCARTIFPQPGLPACWWLERHTARWQ
jgi:hypothetical protein